MQTCLLHILHRALIQARNLALQGKCQPLCDLADTFELLPELMARWDETSYERIRNIFAEYQAKYPECGHEYVSLLTWSAEDSVLNGRPLRRKRFKGTS